jgi:hypothetical protein
VQNGFPASNLKINSYGENSDSKIMENRRVEIKVTAIKSDLKVGNHTIDNQKFLIDNQKDTVLITKSESYFFIPKNSFVTQQGKGIMGDVEVTITEYRSPLDFIMSDIPMSFEQNGELVHFNSAGMFDISANTKNQSLELNKNKTIDVVYNTVKSVPDWDFFALDTNNHWNNNTHQVSFAQQIGIGNGFASIQNCVTKICTNNIEGNYEFIKLGDSLKLHTNDLDFFYSNLKQCADVETTISDYKQQFLYPDIISKKSDLKEFQNNYIIDVKNNSIEIESKNTTYDDSYDLTKLNWKIIEKEKDAPNSFTMNKLILLKGKNNTFQINYPEGKMNKPGTIIIKPQGISKREINKILERRDSLKELYRQEEAEKVSELMGKIKISENELNRYLNNSNKTLPIYDCSSQLEGMKCFYEKCESYVPNEVVTTFKESNDEVKSYFKYFENDQSSFDSASAEIRTKGTLETFAQKEKIRQMKIQKAEKQVTSLRIAKTGIYNCDQIERLKNPITITPKYKTKEGKTIYIYCIYLIDNNLNGILKYDGYMGYSPYKFAYSPSSKNTLLAYDAEGKLYIIKDEQLNNSNIFVLEEIDKNQDVNKLIN